MYRTSTIKSGQICVRKRKEFATQAGTVARAMPSGRTLFAADRCECKRQCLLLWRRRGGSFAGTDNF
jgi:hypothetical protein